MTNSQLTDSPAPLILPEFRRCPQENEVFFQFNSDHHAEAFRDWWENHNGYFEFYSWYQKHAQEYR